MKMPQNCRFFFTILHTPWQLCFFDMVGWKFTLCQYCKKFSSWKKSFLWSRWSPAEGQLIFPFRFYGSKIWQFFLAANLLQKHFSLSFCSRWGISIEIIWHADKWFPWTRRRFSWAEASLKGIARSGLDWLIDHSTFPVSFPSRKKTPFLKSLLSVWSSMPIWDLILVTVYGDCIHRPLVWVHCSQVSLRWMMNVFCRRGSWQQSRNPDGTEFNFFKPLYWASGCISTMIERVFGFWQKKRKEGDVAPSPRETFLSEWVGINWEKVLIQFNQMSFWSDSKGKKWKTISASS